MLLKFQSRIPDTIQQMIGRVKITFYMEVTYNLCILIEICTNLAALSLLFILFVIQNLYKEFFFLTKEANGKKCQ